MAPKKKPAMSGRLSMCARILHQLGNVPVADMMTLITTQIFLASPVQLCFVLQKIFWMKTCMIFVIRTKEDPA